MLRATRTVLLIAAAALAALLIASAGPAAASSSSKSKTTWLCQPGMQHDPCTVGFATTLLGPDGQPTATVPSARAEGGKPKADCFYVYPTVSDQKRPQANREIDPELRSIAHYQAARFSSVCRVFAPVYRQITLAGLLDPKSITDRMRRTAYNDVRNAWREYLKRYNKGRGVIFLSHSQGTFMLRELLRREVERKRSVRHRVVSAMLLGGNVLVRKGKSTGGDFRHLRACRRESQVGCVIAFSTYNAPPPANALFGRASTTIFGAAPKGMEVLCTNPAKLGGGTGLLGSIFPSEPFAPGTTIGAATTQVGVPIPAGVTTPWLSALSYTGRCETVNGANVLMISPRPGAPELHPVPDPSWGLHLVDMNIAQGNLVALAGEQIRAYRKRHR